MLSCERLKTELFENADVTASIYYVSEHAHGSLGITRGHFACLFSFIEVRTSKFACSSVLVWTAIFSNTLLVETWIFFIRMKKMCFQNYPDTCGRDLCKAIASIFLICAAIARIKRLYLTTRYFLLTPTHGVSKRLFDV